MIHDGTAATTLRDAGIAELAAFSLGQQSNCLRLQSCGNHDSTKTWVDGKCGTIRLAVSKTFALKVVLTCLMYDACLQHVSIVARLSSAGSTVCIELECVMCGGSRRTVVM